MKLEMQGHVHRFGLKERAAALSAGIVGFMAAGVQASFSQSAEPIAIPMVHVADEDDADDFNALGIMIGINNSTPRLFQFDTGSDDFLAQIDANTPGVTPVPGHKPEMTAYGDGTYGYWMQKVQFGYLSYHDPKDPSAKSIEVLTGRFAAGQILDWVFTKDHYGFKNHKTSHDPVGRHDGKAIYADLEVRERIKNGDPSDHPPFYGTFGAGNFRMEGGASAALGAQTKTGYIISANANMGDDKTPGCAPCLMLNLTPNLRAQFTALMPWGKLDYDGYQRQFDQTGTNASTEHEGSYSYTISVKVGKKKRSAEFKGPILFDTGTAEFIYIEQDKVLNALRSQGFKLGEYETDIADFKIHGFSDKLNDLEFDDVEITRISDEDEGNGLTIGLPLFQSNSLMYDLANKTTAYSPYFVSTNDFTTDTGDHDADHLSRITEEIGSSGWLGLAGSLSGSGDLILEKDTNVRLTGINTYTGSTYIAADSYLHLAGAGSIENSSRVTVDGSLSLDQKGNYLAEWGVPHGASDTVLRDLGGSKLGYIFLGAGGLILTAANGQFDGTIVDYDDNGKNMGGGLSIAGGRLTLGGDSDYSGLTEVAGGAELHVTGSLTGDILVAGKLVVDGTIYGTVTVKNGGQLAGRGEIGDVQILPGGRAADMKMVVSD